MKRFFAVSWEIENTGVREAALAVERSLRDCDSSWTVACRDRGMTVLCAGEDRGGNTAIAIGANGVVLGTLFERSRVSGIVSPLNELDPQAAERVMSTRGRELIDAYWGSYVSFLRGPDGALLVLRDPSGSAPCYFIRCGELTLFFSHCRDYFSITTERHAVNWRHIGACLHFSRLVADDTGLADVQQVRAGECAVIREGLVRKTFYWHPVRIYEAGVIEDRTEAFTQLRDAVTSSVGTWASCYGRMLHELSGGLDSSIVLACLATVGRQSDVLCFNMYTETGDGDERAFAHKAADRAGCAMLEIPFRPTAKRLQEMLKTSGVASPALAMLKSEAEDARALHCRARGIEAIFSGQGGDNFFQRRKDAAIPAEYLRRHGLGSKLPRIVRDTAWLTGKSLWSVTRTSIAYGLAHRPLDPYAVCKSPSFWNREPGHAERCGDIRHPWVVEAADLPACKTQQVFDVADAQMFYAPLCDYADIVHPLITQPIMECVLRIPCYVLTFGGQERALARAAFADCVPGEILARTTKGAATSYFQTLIMENADLIRDTLLNGSLVKERLLDAGRLETALSYGALMRGKELGSVLNAFLSESWIANVRAA